jgi:pentatricopeptide repeat protein
MSLLRTLDRTSAVSNTHARPLLSFLWPSLDTKTHKRSFGKRAVNKSPQSPTKNARMDNFFIQALVRAGSCREHAKPISTLCDTVPHSLKHHKPRRKSTWQKPENKEFKPHPESKGPFKQVKNFAEKELQALVDYYGMELDTRPDSSPLDDGNLVYNIGDAHEPWPPRHTDDITHIAALEKLLADEEASHDKVFEAYKRLQSPGVVYLRTITIRALLHHLAIVERPTPIASQRFLSILDDMKTAHIHIIRSEWNSAMHLAGRAMGKVSADDLQSSLHLWREMETRAGIKGGYVTFNILFSVAVKAGKYSLAETFMKEMQARNLPMHRHYRVSLLYYYGVLQNGNAVRKTYQELVAAGDIVDTVVLNAVIAALLRAGEPAAAEHVFERMKRLHASRSTPAPGHQFFNKTWRDRRVLGLHFKHEAKRLRRENKDEELKLLQDFAPVAPDARTYGILIRHHSGVVGNFDRVNELLAEMKMNSVLLDGTIFIVVFHGFNTFGGVRYTSWTASKLDKIWQRYLNALQQNLERTWISRLAVIAALRAFARCADQARTMKAWEEIRPLWQPNEQELENVLGVLRRLTASQMDGARMGFFDGRRPVS